MGVRTINEFPNLTTLVVVHNGASPDSIGDHTLDHLKQLTRVTQLEIYTYAPKGSTATYSDSKAQELKEALPRCRVVFGDLGTRYDVNPLRR